MSTKLKVALTGNPNSGKTTIFNRLTRGRQHVANYPGVTVEEKEGQWRHGEIDVTVVDLPGTYSLTAHSLEERVARDFILNEQPDVVVDVLDASSLERSLYLATQLMQMGVHLVLVLNMTDEAKARGIRMDTGQLSTLLRVPIVSTVGHKGEGLDDLRKTIIDVAEGRVEAHGAELHYGDDIEREIRRLAVMIEQADLDVPQSPRWIAVKLLENDADILGKIDSDEIKQAAQNGIEALTAHLGDTPDILIADHRYGFISGACQECVMTTVEARHSLSDKIDTVVINRYLGMPIFLALMYLVFQLTFTIGNYPMGWLESLFAWLGATVNGFWSGAEDSMLRSLFVDGIIGGVGGVIVFLPNILLLFLAIAFLEGTGYMARAAFIMDKLMHKIGLHGKSFIPMLIGFGCSVPAILATRTLESRRDRLTTMLVLPLMSCGARLTIYALIIPAFFPPPLRAPILLSIYLVGILLAIGAAKVLRLTVLRGESIPFVMELPPYRMPTMNSVLHHMWERAWEYVKKAGTIILGLSIVLWALTSYPKKSEFSLDYDALAQEAQTAEQVHQLQNQKQAEELSYSIAGRVGQALEPVLRPMGFDWRIGTALIGAMAAKEVFVAQMGIVFAVGGSEEGNDALREKLREHYNPLIGFCVMLFCLISTPCVATVAATKQESNSWGWALFQVAGLTLMAYVFTVIVYQAGSLLGIGV